MRKDAGFGSYVPNSISTTLTVYFDGHFWVGIAERIDNERLEACRIVFGAEPSNEDIYQFVLRQWDQLHFCAPIDAAPSRETPRQSKATTTRSRKRGSTRATEHEGPAGARAGTRCPQTGRQESIISNGKRTRADAIRTEARKKKKETSWTLVSPTKPSPSHPSRDAHVRASRTGLPLPPSTYLFQLEAGAGALIPLGNPFEKPPHQQVAPRRHLYAGESKQAAHRHRPPKHRATRDRPLQRSSS